jgi:hypothetical protein
VLNTIFTMTREPNGWNPSWGMMSRVPDIGPEGVRTFAEAEEASENLARQVERARQALSDYHAIHPVIGPNGLDEDGGEPPPTARERAAEAADSPDLHPKA